MSTNTSIRKIIIETFKKNSIKEEDKNKNKSNHKAKTRLEKNFSIYKVYYLPNAWEEFISHRPNKEDLKQFCELHESEFNSTTDFEITKVDLMIRRTK